MHFEMRLACVAGFKTNSRFLNHAILSFLQRIASPDALDLECMLYQVRHLSPLRGPESTHTSSCLRLKTGMP